MSKTTLIEFATRDREAAKTIRLGAQTDLAAAQGEVAIATSRLAEDVKSMTDVDKEIAIIKEARNQTVNPADSEKLLKKLAEQARLKRRAIGEIVVDRRTLSDAQVSRDSATARMAAATATLSAADATFDARDSEHGKRTTWKAALKTAPLRTIGAQAQAKKNSTQFTQANKRINDEIPQPLRALARTRYLNERARLAALADSIQAAEDALADELVAGRGLEGEVWKASLEFERAEQALANFVLYSAERLAQASAAVDALVGDGSLLNDDQQTAIADLAGTLGAGRTKAADLGDKLADAEKVEAAAQRTYEDAVLAARVKDPLADVSTVAAVGTAQANLAKASKDSAKALSDLAAERDFLDDWQSIVPDDAWRKLLAFYEAVTILDEIANADPNALVTDLVNAEDAVATALEKATESARQIEVARAEVDARRSRLDKQSAERVNMLLSALRGDM